MRGEKVNNGGKGENPCPRYVRIVPTGNPPTGYSLQCK